MLVRFCFIRDIVVDSILCFCTSYMHSVTSTSIYRSRTILQPPLSDCRIPILQPHPSKKPTRIGFYTEPNRTRSIAPAISRSPIRNPSTAAACLFHLPPPAASGHRAPRLPTIPPSPVDLPPARLLDPRRRPECPARPCCIHHRPPAENAAPLASAARMQHPRCSRCAASPPPVGRAAHHLLRRAPPTTSCG